MNGYWWCTKCMEECNSKHVTANEQHEVCGFSAIWIDPDSVQDRPMDAMVERVIELEKQLKIERGQPLDGLPVEVIADPAPPQKGIWRTLRNGNHIEHRLETPEGKLVIAFVGTTPSPTFTLSNGPGWEPIIEFINKEGKPDFDALIGHALATLFRDNPKVTAGLKSCGVGIRVEGKELG